MADVSIHVRGPCCRWSTVSVPEGTVVSLRDTIRDSQNNVATEIQVGGTCPADDPAPEPLVLSVDTTPKKADDPVEAGPEGEEVDTAESGDQKPSRKKKG
jgi:hypothetical protein